jgi:site-specific recombinase XerD
VEREIGVAGQTTQVNKATDDDVSDRQLIERAEVSELVAPASWTVGSSGDEPYNDAQGAADASLSALATVSMTGSAFTTLTDMPLARHPAAVYLAALDAGSRRTMRQALNTLANLLGVPPQRDAAGKEVTYLACPWGSLRYQHTSALRAAIAERYAPATANKMLAALRRVLQEAWRLGHMSAEEYARARDVPLITGETLPAGRALSAGEIAALLAGCAADPRPAGVRDGALIAALYSTLVRRSEVVAFMLEDYDTTEGTLRVRRGKGRKARLTYLAPGAKAALDAWLALRGTVAGPLFLPLTKSGRAALRALRPQAVAEVLTRRASEARVAACSPHDLRRTAIGDLLDAGADIATVQRLAGHADPVTTARYDRRGERAKRRAAHLLHVPYSEPVASDAIGTRPIPVIFNRQSRSDERPSSSE